MDSPVTFEEVEARRAEAERGAYVEREGALRDMRAVLSTREGRRVVWWLLSEAGLYRATPPGPLEDLSYAAGERNQGQKLLARVIESDAEAYLDMIRERLISEPGAASAGTKQGKRQ